MITDRNTGERSLNDEMRLIHNLRLGNTRAFESIYHLYFQRLYSYCCQFTKSPHDAEDIVQEVFTKLWLTRDKIKQESSLRSLLFTMVRNNLVDVFRRMVSSPLFEDYMDYVNTLGNQDTDTIDYKEFEEQLRNVINQLPPSRRNILELSRFKNMTNKEIAQKLGINEQSVKNSISQSLKFIRSNLNESLVMLMFLCWNS